MSQNTYTFDWSDLVFGSKKGLKQLRPIFIAAPRELSEKRFISLIKQYLPQGNIVLGLAKEEFVLDLEGQPQFKMLRGVTVQPIIDKVNALSAKHKVYTLSYFQRDLKFILEKFPFRKVLLINGSWYRAFHLRPEYYILAKRQIPYEMLSPFRDEQEAEAYAKMIRLVALPTRGAYTEAQMLELAGQAAIHSFDYGGFQTGVSLGEKTGKKYDLLATAHNMVVPYETYAMHHGAARERHFSPLHDLNHYDTIHAEVALLIKAQRQKVDLRGTTLFINLLPCPSCARIIACTDIAACAYIQDHTDGYAVSMLERAGKEVRRAVAGHTV